MNWVRGLLPLFLWAGLADAHTGTLSRSHWQLTDDGMRVQMDLKAADFRYFAAPEELATALTAGIRMNPPGICEPAGATTGFDRGAEQPLSWRYICTGKPSQVRMEWLQQMPGHLHLLRWNESSYLLGTTSKIAFRPNPGAQSTGAMLLEQWRNGVGHIAIGWDHLAFLLGLLLLARNLVALMWLVAGFTLGHSGSLALATLAGWRPPSSAIELAIAASIVLAALPDSVAPLQRRLVLATILGIGLLGALASTGPMLLWLGLGLLGLSHQALQHQSGRGLLYAQLSFATLFGLLHGFGFAGAIIAAAESSSTVWPLLLGFNLGVESGQLLFVVPAWCLLRWLRQHPIGEWSVPSLRGLVCGLGAFWFLSRALA